MNKRKICWITVNVFAIVHCIFYSFESAIPWLAAGFVIIAMDNK